MNFHHFKKDFVICIIIIVMPFLFYLYMLTPNEAKWKTDYFTFSSSILGSVNNFFWLLATRLLMLLILGLWFVTCRHWWRFVILFPLIMEIYKFLGVIGEQFEAMNLSFIASLAYAIPICLILVLISNKLGYYNKSKNINQQLTQEIDHLFSELSHFKKENYTKATRDYKHLLKEKDALSKNEYLQKLIVIRDGLTPIIKNNP